MCVCVEQVQTWSETYDVEVIFSTSFSPNEDDVSANMANMKSAGVNIILLLVINEMDAHAVFDAAEELGSPHHEPRSPLITSFRL